MASSNETTSSVILSTTTSSPSTTSSSSSTTKRAVSSTPITNATEATEAPGKPHGLSDGEIAGIAVGVIGFVFIILAIIVLVLIKRRRIKLLNNRDPQIVEDKEHDKNRQKQAGNSYVKQNLPNVPEGVYENPAADPQNYYNVGKENSVDADHAKGSRKPAIVKQDSVPTMYAPPPPPVEGTRTSMPVERAPNRPVIDEDENDEETYIIPGGPSTRTLATLPSYTGRKPHDSDGQLYIDMSSGQGDELYVDPDSGQIQKNYTNFDAKSKLEDEERKTLPKDYVNLSGQVKGIAFGVHPKNINVPQRQEETLPITTNDQESYQNVSFKNRSKKIKKPQRKK